MLNYNMNNNQNINKNNNKNKMIKIAKTIRNNLITTEFK